MSSSEFCKAIIRSSELQNDALTLWRVIIISEPEREPESTPVCPQEMTMSTPVCPAFCGLGILAVGVLATYTELCEIARGTYVDEIAGAILLILAIIMYFCQKGGRKAG